MNQITFRHVKEGDAALLRHLALNCPPLDVHTPYTYWINACFFGTYSFLAYDMKKPIGYIMCLPKDDLLFVWQIGLLDEYRGKKLSYSLIKLAFENAENCGIKKMAVTIAPDNLASYNAFKNYCVENGYTFTKTEAV